MSLATSPRHRSVGPMTRAMLLAKVVETAKRASKGASG
jgi:5,10-methylene-tetrahydrofolate dehydrogenase/methenyl tetrahydrofolate cyclohydrolase